MQLNRHRLGRTILWLILVPVLIYPHWCLAADPVVFQTSRNRYFTVYYREKNLRIATIISADCDSFARRFCGELKLRKPETPIPIYLDPPIAGKNEVFPSPRWIQGFYQPDKRMIVVKTLHQFGRGMHQEALIVFRHEAVHAILHQNVPDIPRWLDEGIAQSFSRGFTIEDGRMLRRLPVSQFKKYLTEEAFSHQSSAQLAYPLASGLVSYLRELGETRIGTLLNQMQSTDLDMAFSSTYGVDMDFFFHMFRENFLSRYTLFNLLISDEGVFALMTVLALILILTHKIRTRKKLERLGDSEEPYTYAFPYQQKDPYESYDDEEDDTPCT